MLAPKRQVVLLAKSFGQGIVPLVFAYVSHLPVSVRLQRRFRSSYLIGIVKKNAIMMINFGPRGRAQPGPDSCRRCLLPCVFLAAASYPYVLAVFVVVYRACPNDRPNHVGIAVQRHLRTGRIQERDGKLYSISPAT